MATKSKQFQPDPTPTPTPTPINAYSVIETEGGAWQIIRWAIIDGKALAVESTIPDIKAIVVRRLDKVFLKEMGLAHA